LVYNIVDSKCYFFW